MVRGFQVTGGCSDSGAQVYDFPGGEEDVGALLPAAANLVPLEQGWQL